MTAVASVHDANVEQHPKERQKICVRVVRPKRRATQLDAQVVRMVHAAELPQQQPRHFEERALHEAGDEAEMLVAPLMQMLSNADAALMR